MFGDFLVFVTSAIMNCSPHENVDVLLLSQQLNIQLSERGLKTVAVACSFIYVYEIGGGFTRRCRRRIGPNVRPATAGCTRTVPITRPLSHLIFFILWACPA